ENYTKKSTRGSEPLVLNIQGWEKGQKTTFCPASFVFSGRQGKKYPCERIDNSYFSCHRSDLSTI
ncbi:hypothetical protein, partial [Halalkalibacter oceani]